MPFTLYMKLFIFRELKKLRQQVSSMRKTLNKSVELHSQPMESRMVRPTQSDDESPRHDRASLYQSQVWSRGQPEAHGFQSRTQPDPFQVGLQWNILSPSMSLFLQKFHATHFTHSCPRIPSNIPLTRQADRRTSFKDNSRLI